MSALTGRVRSWEQAGRYVDVDGRRIYTQRADGAGPTIVFLHGYPSSCYDWRLVLPALDAHRALLFDFLGFGLSAKPRDVRYSLLAQADVVEALVASSAAGPVLIVAHDMGTWWRPSSWRATSTGGCRSRWPACCCSTGAW